MYSKQKYYIAFVIFFLGVFLVGYTNVVFGQDRKQLENEKRKIENEIRKLNKDLSSVKKGKSLSSSQVNTLNKKIKEREKLITNINSQLTILETQIASTSDSIVSLKYHIEALKQEYAKVVCVLYKDKDCLSKMALTTNPLQFNKDYLRLKYYAAYSRYRKHQAQLIKNHQQELENISFDLIVQKSKKQNLLSQEEQNKKQLSSEKVLQQKNLSKYQKQEKDLSQKLKQKEKQAKQLQSQIQKIINEELAKARKAKTNAKSNSKTLSVTPEEVALSNDFIANKGRLPWPVEKASVIREYGRYRHQSGGENMNNGIELLTDQGSLVRSIFEGTVTRIATGPNGYKMVFIKHGDFISVYTNLESVSVKEGSQVSTKQKIGVIHTNTENRSEINFQIWEGKSNQVESQNPRIWLSSK